MQILVIGGTRFVGYQLVWRLLAAGHRVTLLNRGLRADPFGERVERLVADRTTPAFDSVLGGRRFDAAIDFAAFTGEDARQVVTRLGDGRVGHYVFISTGQVYLVRDKCPQPARESDYDGPLLPKPLNQPDSDEWLYGVRKREAEDVLAAASSTMGFPATRLRIPMVNGERDHFRRIESYLWRILDGGPVLLPDGGGNRLRHVYSGDIVKVIANLLGNSATFGQVYNLAQDDMPTLAELVTLLADLLGAPARLVTVSAQRLRENGLEPAEISPFSNHWMSRIDATKAKEELSFHPEPLRQYLDKIIACFLNHPTSEPPGNYAHRGTELALARI